MWVKQLGSCPQRSAAANCRVIAPGSREGQRDGEQWSEDLSDLITDAGVTLISVAEGVKTNSGASKSENSPGSWLTATEWGRH